MLFVTPAVIITYKLYKSVKLESQALSSFRLDSIFV